MTKIQLRRNTRFKKPYYRRRRDLGGNPQKRAVCMKVTTLAPRKPHSATRRIARCSVKHKFRFRSAGRYKYKSRAMMLTAGIPGEGHNLQKHSVVLVRGGRTKDLPGVRYKMIRGKFDLRGLVTRRRRRSIFGTELPEGSAERGPYIKIKIWRV